MFRIQILLFISLTLFYAFGQSPKPKKEKIVLWSAGGMHADEVLGKTGQKWLGLFSTPTGFELSMSTITVLDSEGIMPDDKFVKTNLAFDNVFLIRGIPELKLGPVKTVYFGTQSLQPGNGINLNLSAKYISDYHLHVEGKDSDGVIANFKLRLSGDGKTQTLIMRDITYLDGMPCILWAGDLDQDAKLDLLLDLSVGDNERVPTLFLSSKADSTELVKKVASYRRLGC